MGGPESYIREMEIHVYAKREKSDSSSEFLRRESNQIKTVQNNSYAVNWRETAYFLVLEINS